MEDVNTCKAVCPCDEKCPVGEALALVGGKWKMRIICSLYVDGTQRYNDLVKKTRGITSAMLSSSLKDLENGGLVIRKQYEAIPPRVEYSLTDLGKSLMPIVGDLINWAVMNFDHFKR